MADVLGRTVLHRDRYARVWGLGDRKAAAAITPTLVLMEDDPPSPRLCCIHHLEHILASLNAQRGLRAAFSPPNSKKTALTIRSISAMFFLLLSRMQMLVKSKGPLPLTRFLAADEPRRRFDRRFPAPEIVVLTDALQLASQPGKLPLALLTLKHRFPVRSCGRLDLVAR